MIITILSFIKSSIIISSIYSYVYFSFLLLKKVKIFNLFVFVFFINYNYTIYYINLFSNYPNFYLLKIEQRLYR